MKRLRILIERLLVKFERIEKISKKKLAKMPEGDLKVSKRNGKNYFYCRKNGKVTYIKTTNVRRIAELANREKYEKLLKFCNAFIPVADKMLKVIETFENVRIDDIKEEYTDNDVVSDEKYARIWESDYPIVPLDEKHTILTKKGDYVRSKSEKMIADFLYECKIPYKYEVRLIFDDGNELMPDFIMLDTESREEIIWEHFGIIDDVNYAARTIEKMSIYSQNGYNVNDNLFCTFETQVFRYPFDLLNQVIKKRFVA